MPSNQKSRGSVLYVGPVSSLEQNLNQMNPEIDIDGTGFTRRRTEAALIIPVAVNGTAVMGERVIRATGDLSVPHNAKDDPRHFVWRLITQS